MRILKVTQSYAPYLERGGPAVKIPAIARHLACRGHHVTILTAHYGKPLRTAIRSDDGIEVLYLAYCARFRALTVNPGVFAFCHARLREFDLVHCYGLYDILGPVVAWFARRAGIRYVVEPLGMTTPIGRSLWLKRLWGLFSGPGYLSGAAMLIATSEQERQELISSGFPPAQVVVRENGVDIEEFRNLAGLGSFRHSLGIEPEEPLILFLGRLIPRKGADLLVEAFAEACPGRGKLVLGGPEEIPGYAASLRRRVDALGLTERVIFTGALYGRRKVEALSDADLFVLPSQYENFANTAAEAIACGTPVIVSDRCGISPLIHGKAGLTVSCDKTRLADAMRELLNDHERYEALRAGCRDLAESLSWRPLIERMERYYGEVAGHAV